MRIHLLLSLALFSACAVDGSTDTTDLSTSAVRPSDEQLPHGDAAELCGADLRLPTQLEMMELLGDCREATEGLECTPCAAGGCAQAYPGDRVLAHGQVWTSTDCVLPGNEPGYYLANFFTGQIVCWHISEPEGLPLCVR